MLEADLCDIAAIAAAMPCVEIAFHGGELFAAPRFREYSSISMDVNTMEMLNVRNTARAAGVRCVTPASPSSVFGDMKVSPKHERLKPDTFSEFAISKQSAAYICGEFTQIYGRKTVPLRYIQDFGLFQNPVSLFSMVNHKFRRAPSFGTHTGIGMRSNHVALPTWIMWRMGTYLR